MKKRVGIAMLVLILSALAVVPAFAGGNGRGGEGQPVIYVTSQELYYDSIVLTDLPPSGPFQQLFPPGTNPDYPALTTLSTEYGPGSPGHVGGRWWIDANGDGEMNEGDMFFMCPLLGPGRESP